MTFDSLIETFKSVDDINKAINSLTRKAKLLRKNAKSASTLAEKLTINKEIKNINEISFKLKLSYFQLEDQLKAIA